MSKRTWYLVFLLVILALAMSLIIAGQVRQFPGSNPPRSLQNYAQSVFELQNLRSKSYAGDLYTNAIYTSVDLVLAGFVFFIMDCFLFLCVLPSLLKTFFGFAKW